MASVFVMSSGGLESLSPVEYLAILVSMGCSLGDCDECLRDVVAGSGKLHVFGPDLPEMDGLFAVASSAEFARRLWFEAVRSDVLSRACADARVSEN